MTDNRTHTSFFRCSCSVQTHAPYPNVRASQSSLNLIFAQLKFHGDEASASTSPIEKCRLHLHVTALLSAIFSAIYFAMVVAGEMRLALVVLGVLQIPVFISLPVLSTRMWIYT